MTFAARPEDFEPAFQVYWNETQVEVKHSFEVMTLTFRTEDTELVRVVDSKGEVACIAPKGMAIFITNLLNANPI